MPKFPTLEIPGPDAAEAAMVVGRSGPVDARAELIAAGPRGSLAKVPWVLDHSIDDLTRLRGPAVYDRMVLDAKVESCVEYLVKAALADDMQVSPAVEPPPEDIADLIEVPPTEADVKLAAELRDFCQWNVDRLDRPADEISAEMIRSSLVHGCKLAEQVYELCDDGPWKGRLALKSIKPKPRQTWNWVVDRFMNVLGIRAVMMPDGGPGWVPREKIAALTWMPRDGDPRGTSILRSVYDWWNLKVNLIPEAYRFSQTLAKPKAFVTVPVDAPSVDPALAPGSGVSGRPLSYIEFMAWQLENSSDAEFLIASQGTTYEVKGPGGEGKLYGELIDACDRQIAAGILGATRMTEEAQHGSKADSQTAQDVVGLRVRRVKAALKRMWEWDIFYHLVLWNYGRDVADRLTPKVTLGDTEHHDFATSATAWASLKTAGMLSPNQFPAVYRDLGKVLPDFEEPEPPALVPPGQAVPDKPGEGPPDSSSGPPQGKETKAA